MIMTTTTTSSSSAAVPAAARSPTRWPAPASGSCSSNGATTCPREMDNWDPEPVFIDGKYISEDTWYDADGKPFQPQVHYYVGGATKLYGAALYRLRPQDFGELRHVDGLSPAWPLTLRRPRAVVLARPSGCTRSTATPARTRPRGRARSRTRGRRCPTSRGSSSCPTTWQPAATTRSTRRAGSCSTRPTGPRARASAARGATATRAWSTPSPTPRRSPSARCSTCPNVTLLVDAEVTELETDADRADGHRRRRVAGRRRRRSTPATSSSCRPGRPTRPSCCSRSANDRHPNGLANGSDQVGRNYMFHNCKAVVALRQGAQRHRLPEDARAQRLLLRRPRLRLAGRATSRWSASPTPRR